MYKLAVQGLKDTQKHYTEDVLSILLSDTRSINTRRAYLKDLQLFFRFITNQPPSAEIIQQFLELNREQAVVLVLRFKADCLERGLAEATVNRRLAAIKALVRMGSIVGACNYSLDDIRGERVEIYRDTTGVEISTFNKCLALCDLQTIKGKRDYALLHLLWSNALRRGEVAQLKMRDLDLDQQRLRIFGKGRGTQSEWIDLSNKTLEALQNWLATRAELTEESPIFSSLHAGCLNQTLTTTGIYKIVNNYFKIISPKQMSPHRIRHSAITAALDIYNGDVRKVQKFSRHKSINTLMIYDDNRQNIQKQVSRSLADLLE
jgi:integrase/recombinase XerC